MSYVYFFLAIVLFLCILRVEGTIFTPSSIIVVSWCLFPGIASLHPLRLYELSLDTHFVIFLSLVSFLCAYYFILSLRPYNNTKVTPSHLNGKVHVNYTLLIWANIICVIWLFPKTMASWAAIQTIGWVRVRAESPEMFGSTAANILYSDLARPLFVSCLAIISVDLLRSFKMNFKKFIFLLLVIINITQDTIIFAARATLVKVVIYFVFSYFFVNRKILTLQKKFIFVLILFIMYNVLSLVTAERNSQMTSNDSFIDTMVVYYIAPFGVLNYYINNNVISIVGGNVMTFGTCLFGFVYNLFCIFFTIFGGFEYVGSDHAVTQVTSKYVYVAPNILMNAACTADYAFLSDFGLFGVIIGFMLCAYVIIRIRRRYNINPSIRNGAIYIFMLYTLFRLSVNYDFLFPSAIFSLIYIWMGTITRKEFLHLLRIR